MENLDKRLLVAILSIAQDSDSQVNDAINEKTSANLRPFHWYNYLQQERPVEFSAFNEFIQKLQTGNFHLQVVVPLFLLRSLKLSYSCCTPCLKRKRRTTITQSPY